MDNTSPPCNRVREITGKTVREAVKEGLSIEETIESIRQNVREGLMLYKQEIRQELGTLDGPVENCDVNVESLSINEEDDEFTALIEVDGRRGAILVADSMDNTCPSDNRVREVADRSVLDAIKEDMDKKGTIRLIEENIKKILDKESRVKGLNVNIEDNEFTALVQIKGRRGAVPISGELY